MGKTRTFPYRLEFRCVSGRHYTSQEWRTRSHRLYGPAHGRPTAENIDRWVTSFEQSMRDGTNKHLGLDQVVFAQVVDQRTDDVVAEWKRGDWRKSQPLFQVV